jgi:VCBS repeat-containing protein
MCCLGTQRNRFGTSFNISNSKNKKQTIIARNSKMATSREIALIDFGIANIDTLISGLRPGIEAIVLSAEECPLVQMVRAVEGQPFDVVHIVAHGRSGEINFGGETLSLETIGNNLKDLAALGLAVRDGGSLQLWSCETAQGERGEAFVEALSRATGAAVAASTETVGAAELGGRWELDRLSAEIAARVPMTAQGVANYSGIMAVVSLTKNEDIFDGLGAGTTAGDDTIIVTQSNQVDNTLADNTVNPPIAQAIDIINGGAGIDTVQIGAGGAGVNIDLGKVNAVGPAHFLSIEGLAFSNISGVSSARLIAEQFGPGLIANNLTVTGVLGTTQAIQIDFFNANGGVFDASAWQFVNWTSGTDTITIRGSAGDDTITGTTAADSIDGNTGDDTINLANGYFALGESINGGANGAVGDRLVLINATTVDFTTGVLSNIEQLNGSAGNDALTMSFGQWNGITSSVNLAAGVNTLNVVASTIGAGNGNLGTGPATITNVTTGNLVGTDGNDTIAASGAQIDAIIIGAGTVNLGLGVDTINLSTTSADLNTLGATDASISGVENIAISTAGGVTVSMSGQTEAFNISGGGGADSITGGLGGDTISGGSGADSINAGLGNDTINLASGDFVAGETINGGGGTDTIALINNVTVDLSVGSITAVENLVGSAASDTVSLSATQLTGFSTIDLVGATNTLNVIAIGDITSATTATLANVTTGNLRGTVGNDTITLTGAQLDSIIIGGGTIDLGLGSDTINLTSTSSTLNALGTGNNNAIGALENISAATAASGVTIALNAQTEAFNVTGSNNADTITGGSGADVINGNGGADNIFGGTGVDNINGGTGNDTISGGTGADILTGGSGGDTFNFAAGDSALVINGNLTTGTVTGFDTILDFTPGSVAGTSDAIGVAGAAIATNTAATNGTNSVLQLHTSLPVASHSIVNGMISFSNAEAFSAAVPLTTAGDIAAAVQYLQANNLGGAGVSVAFTATLGGVAHTFVFVQGDATGANNGLDELIDIPNLTPSSITASGGQISLHVVPLTVADTLQATEDKPITYTAQDLLGNDTNAIGIASVTSGAGGTVVLNPDGTVTFTPSANFNGPASFTYVATEGVVNSASTNVTVNVAAVNDAPIAIADTNSATEDAAVIVGSVATNDSDVDVGATLTYTLVAPVAGLTLGANGSYSFDPSNVAYQHLAQGETANVVANYTVTDDHGATATSTLTITLTGTNDAATIAGTSVAAVTEDVAPGTASGTLTVTDVDTGQNQFKVPASLAGTYGTFTFNAATGVWGYTLNNAQANVQALSGGQIVHDTLSVTSLDGTATQVINVTVTGSNEAAVLSSASISLNETDAPLTTSGTLSITDIDSPATFVAQTNFAGANGVFSITTAGAWTYTANSAFDALNVGQSVIDTFTVAAFDGTTTTVSITINGTTDVINGTSSADTLTGHAGADIISGFAGNDTLNGGGGNDQLDGGVGSDTLNGGIGQDTILLGNGLAGDTDHIDGGADRDLLDMSSITNGGVFIDFGYNLGPNQLFTFDGFASVTGMESMVGTSFNDTMRGDSGSNLIDGGAGDDILLGYSPYDTANPLASLGDVMLGGAGNDLLFSGTGNDFLDGGTGNDIIEVGGGTDTVVTGTGNDTIFFSPNNGTDTVTDFTGGPGVVDVLKLYGFGTAFDTSAEVIAAASQHGLDTWITLPGTTIILQNFTATTLANDDFVFV